MITIHVQYFARCRELAGRDQEDLSLPDGSTTEHLASALCDSHPALAPLLPSIRLAVNEEFARKGTGLSDGDLVALIPPVSGGAPFDERFVITSEPCAYDAAVGLLRDPPEDRGALATFAGLVRRQSNNGKPVTHLEYEAHAPMAVKMMRRIEAEVRGQWPILDMAVVHRTGLVRIGEVAVSVAVSGVHRKEALEACRYVIDRLKQDVPIWKKETGADGEEWWSEGS